MSNFEERKKLIDELQKKRNSVLITYFTLTDRTNMTNLMIADDAIEPLHSLLEETGTRDRIELLLYTRGGAMMSAYSIVKLFREYTKEFNVLVPFRAHSAGTQLALGANNIVMGKMGVLSPVDPSTGSVFNPILNPQVDPSNPLNRKQISVEDVQAYLNLARDKVGLCGEDHKLEVFKELTKNCEPLALGNVNRVYNEIRRIAKEVLSLHMDSQTNEEKIENIIRFLTEVYTHDFQITRDLAKEIGLKVVQPSTVEEELMMKIYYSYAKEFKMAEPFDAEILLPQQYRYQTIITQLNQTIPNPVPFKVKLGAIENANNSYIWISDGVVYPPLLIPNMINREIPSINIKCGSWNKNPGAGTYV